jgi:NhaA family Na+:H+ antiporter
MTEPKAPSKSLPPGVWKPAQQAVRTLVRPLEAFLHIQASSGILLLIASIVALVLANSSWRGAYEHLWHVPLSIGVGTWQFTKPLHFWINDGLMVVFFFVVGLEIRREIHSGELSEMRRAVLPAAAALGGMIAPAAIYFALNAGSVAQGGWGVPMATDIAFAVGVLALLGKRVPAALRVLLLALAIIDDIGAILVIALFYSTNFSLMGLVVVVVGIALTLGMRAIGVRRPSIYILPGIVVWAGFLISGIHPTIAGVVLGLLTPARPWYGKAGFIDATERSLEKFRHTAQSTEDPHDLLEPLSEIGEARREAISPVIRLEDALHPWVAYGIMPLFAFANAGVYLGDIDFSGASSLRLTAGVILGLVFGKPIGVVAACYLAMRTGIASFPKGISWKSILLVGVVAGIGFTMAIFIAGLAFPDPRMLGTAKVAILVASAIAGVFALILGLILLPKKLQTDVAQTEDEAERSTDK